MMDMELQFPGDARDVSARSRTNMGHWDRWASVAAGAALALYGASRRKPSGVALALGGALLMRRGAIGHCDVYQALDLNTSRSATDTRRALGGSSGVIVEEAVTVNRPAADLFRFWRTLENLPRFMHHLQSVDRVSDTVSRWRARGPGGRSVEWNAEIINEVQDQLIAWRSIEGSQVVSAGSVHFDEGGPGRGTRIRVRLQYSPPGGKAGAAIARLFGRDAATEIREDLRRFKQLLETGEVPTTEGQPRGK